MPAPIRRRRTLHLPVTLNVLLMGLNVALMVCWIVFLSRSYQWTALTIGTVLFSLVLIGLTLYLILSIKAVRLHARQVNFVDSVTHELKTPIAAVRLYLDTLRLHGGMEVEERAECYEVMSRELNRLDGLINQLLVVGRLERLGAGIETEAVDVTELIAPVARTAAHRHGCEVEEVFTFDLHPVTVAARPMLLEMVLSNLLDNAVKYGGEPPRVSVEAGPRSDSRGRPRAIVRVADRGAGVPAHLRTKIFDLFYRGGNELERTRRGTGLGLYIVLTLVTLLGGRVRVFDRAGGPGSVFEVDLPADTRAAATDAPSDGASFVPPAVSHAEAA